MAEKFVVKAQVREGRGTNDARRLRNDGQVPITVYGGGGESISVTAAIGDLAAIIRSETGANTLFTLDIEGVEEARVIFQERQIDPVRGRLIHADLRRLAKGEKIEVTVPIVLVGNPVGVRNEGGLLEQQMRELRVLCTPSNIPESIEVDVEDLEASASIPVSEVKVDDEIEILEAPEQVVASVVFVKEEEEEVEVEEGLEPEVIGEAPAEDAGDDGDGSAEGGD